MTMPEKQPCNTDDEPLNRDEIMTALASMLGRMDAVAAACADGFPLYAPGHGGRWATSAGGSWVGGFWSGGWWLRARLTESAQGRSKAAQICRSLAPKTGADTVNRSLIFWYGAGLGDLWFGDADARKLAEEAAAALADSYDPALQCIPLGTDLGGGKDGGKRIAVDAWASLIQLLGHSGRREHERIARAHTDTLAAVCRGADGAFHAHAHCSEHGLRPSDTAGDWSRGQAWAMLGLARAAERWGEPYLNHARSACEYWRRSRPEPWPPNRLADPAGLCDPSSAVIASLAMLSLAALVPDGDRWRFHAHRQIGAIIRSRYFTGLQKNGDDAAKGIFWGCCCKTRSGKEEPAESAWGNFLLMAALGALAGAVDPGHC